MSPITENMTDVEKPRPALLGLPLVIFRSVLEQLYQDGKVALVSLRLTSRICLRECDRLFYRTFKLQERIHDKRTQLRTQKLIERVLDTEDTLASHVRHLIIGPFEDEKYFRHIIAQQLDKMVSATTCLRSLSWNTTIPIPPGCLDTFHRLHPTTQLHVESRKRDGRSLDRHLLSSPQLHLLDINIYCKQPYRLNGTGKTELQFLKQYLMQGQSIKVLRFEFETNTAQLRDDDVRNTWPDGPINFHWAEGDRFPALEELTLRGMVQYEWTVEQCEAWIRCMDWSHLRKLDLGQSIRQLHWFRLLTEKVPQLKSFSVAVFDWYAAGDNQGDEPDLAHFKKFLLAICGLEEIRLECAEFEAVLVTLLSQHGHSLTSINLHRVGAKQQWTKKDYVDLLEKAPKLALLAYQENPPGKDATDVEGKWLGSEVQWAPQEKYDRIKNKIYTFYPTMEID